MTNDIRQFALLTRDAQRAELINQMVMAYGWRLLLGVNQPQPVQWARSQRAQLLIVDLDQPDAIGIVQQLSQTLPGLPIIVLASAQHMTELQDAMLAGATDFVAQPINPRHFVAAVERVLQNRPAAPTVLQGSATQAVKRSRLIAVVGLHGGVGRSTIATNLALALQQRGKGDVILAEAHLSLSQLSLMLHLRPRYTLANLEQEKALDVDMLRAYLQPHSSGVRILAAPTEIGQLVDLPGELWHKIIPLLLEAAPHVIMDTASAADNVLSDVLLHADEIIVVLHPDLVSLRNAAALLKLIDSSGDVRGRTHLVLNRAGVSGGLDEATIRKQLGQELAAVLPEDPALATYALNRGVPFIVSHPRALLSRRIEGLLDQLSAAAQPKIGALPTLALPGPVAPAAAKKSRATGGLLSFIGL